MEIFKVNNVKNIGNPEEVFLEIDITINNLSKILLIILYYREYKFKNFVLNYDYENIKLPITKVVQKLKGDILKFVESQDVVVGFRGIPKCVFEKELLRPGLRWYFEDKILYFEPEKKSMESFTCDNNCMFFENCSEVSQDYIEAFGNEEFLTLLPNNSLYDLNYKEINKFNNQELILFLQPVLENYKKDKFYLRKKIVFVKSFPNNFEESSKERVSYFIYNRKDDFEETYNFLGKYIDNVILDKFRTFLILSNQFAISLAIMGDDHIRKTLYFTIEDFDNYQIEELSSMLGFEIKNENYWGIGIDFKEESVSYKIYYKYTKIKNSEIKGFVSEFDLECKKKLMRFLNSLTKPLNQVLLDYKFKNGEFYSKKIEFSFQYDSFKLNQLSLILGFDFSYFVDKEIYTLSFEIREGLMEKVNVYYLVKFPEINNADERYR